jgi:transposase-like protein
MSDARAFRGCRFPAEVILGAVRWYLRFPLSYRDLERLLVDRGVAVDHVSLYRWVQRFAPELERRLRRHLCPCRGPWHVDETFIRVGGAWRYLYRAVDGAGQTIDFLLSATRDKKAARRFFRRALGRDNTRTPRVVVTDRLKSYPGALRAMKRAGGFCQISRQPASPAPWAQGRIGSGGFQDAQRCHGPAEEAQSPLIGGDVLAVGGTEAEEAAELVVGATEPPG